jgi:WD40 repeat protein
MATSKTTGCDRSVHVGRDAIGNTIVTGDKNKIIIYQTIQQVDTEELSVDEIGPNPYLGLGAFQEKDADRFFGREKLTKKLWGKFRDLNEPSVSDEPKIRLLPIIGPSGSGKSSLARAGLSPELARQPLLPGLDSARIAVLTPGTHPLEALAGVMARIATNDATPVKKTAEFTEVLNEKNDEQQYKGLQRIANLLPSIESSPLVVLVDQFEEVYSLCEDKDECQVFIENLLHTASDRSGRVSVILTLRSDFLGETQSNEKLNITIARQGEIVPAMSEVELRDAISKPAANAGHPLDEYTINQLISQTKGREGALPLLQFALTRIWEGLAEGIEAAETLRGIGGVGGALAGEAQRLYDKLDDDQKNIARRAFMAMIQLGEGTRDTRRRVRVADVIVPGEDSERVRQVLNIFCGRAARLITLSSDEAGIQTAEVSHEALLEHWHALNTWLDSSRDDLRFQRRLDEAARHWDHEGCPDGLLWRPPDLDLLVIFHQRKQTDMSNLQIGFFESSRDSEHKRREAERRRRRFIFAIVGVAAVVFLVLALLARSQRNEAREQLKIALSGQLAAQAVHHLDEQRDLSLLLSLEAYQSANTTEARRSLIAGLEYNPYLITFLSNQNKEFHSKQIAAVAFSPNGEILVAGSMNGEITLWDAANRKPLEPPLIKHPGPPNRNAFLNDLAFSPDGKLLVSCATNGGIIFWDVETFQSIDQLYSSERTPYTSLAFSPDGKLLASGIYDRVILWDVTTRKQIDQPFIVSQQRRGEGYTIVTFSPDGKKLAVGSDRSIVLWDVATHKSLGPPLTHSSTVLSLAFSSDGKILASSGEDGKVILWDVAARRQIDQSLTESSISRVRSVAFSPDGKMLAAASKNLLWDIDRREKLTDFTGYSSITSVAFSPDGKILASGCFDGTVMLWDVMGRQSLGQPFIEESKPLQHVVFSLNGRKAAAIKQGKITIWDIANRQQPGQTLIDHEGYLSKSTFSPDGNILASFTGERVILWDVADNYKRKTQIVLRDFIPEEQFYRETYHCITFSPDGKTLAIGINNTILLWNTVKEEPIGPVLRNPDRGKSITFSPDGRTLAVGGYGVIHLWDVADHELIDPPINSPGYTVRSMRFSPDGKILASGGDAGILSFWDVMSHKHIGTQIEVPSVRLKALAFGPDGKTLASGASDGTVLLWDVITHQPLSPPLTGHKDEVEDLWFSLDGKTLVSGSQDGTFFLWDLDPESWQARACTVAGRNLSLQEWQQFLGDRPYRKTCPDVPIHPSFIESFIEAGRDLARAGDVEGAVKQFQRALQADPSLDLNPEAEAQRVAASALFAKVSRLITQGEIDEALAVFSDMQKINPTMEKSVCNKLCWLGSLWGYAAEVMHACEHAVELAPNNGGVRDSRGLARALTGDYQGAVEDFQFYVEWGPKNYRSPHTVRQRQEWIRAIKDGKNPFDSKTLEELRNR